MSSKRGARKEASDARINRMTEEAFGEDQVSEFKEAFDMLSDGSNAIDKAELKKKFKLYGLRISEDELEKAYSEADNDGDGKIMFPEFMAMMSAKMRQTSSEAKLVEAFRTFDPEGKGFIPTEELQKVLTTLGKPLTAREMADLTAIAEMTPGEIRYQQFIDVLFMKK